jgi:hypothetical protein
MKYKGNNSKSRAFPHIQSTERNKPAYYGTKAVIGACIGIDCHIFLFNEKAQIKKLVNSSADKDNKRGPYKGTAYKVIDCIHILPPFRKESG